MPRRTKAATRRTFSLPYLQLERLEHLSQLDETPLAELLRRVADLITTFDFRGKMPIGPDLHTTSAVKFIAYMSDPMYQSLINEAADQNIPPNELLRRGIDLYLNVKKVPTLVGHDNHDTNTIGETDTAETTHIDAFQR